MKYRHATVATAFGNEYAPRNVERCEVRIRRFILARPRRRDPLFELWLAWKIGSRLYAYYGAGQNISVFTVPLKFNGDCEYTYVLAPRIETRVPFSGCGFLSREWNASKYLCAMSKGTQVFTISCLQTKFLEGSATHVSPEDQPISGYQQFLQKIGIFCEYTDQIKYFWSVSYTHLTLPTIYSV